MKAEYLHPPVVHFPIAFYFLELLLLVLWAARRRDDYLRFARFSFRTGYVFMLFALGAGLHDAGGPSGITGLVRRHFFAAVSVFICYTLRIFSWRRGQTAPNYKLLLLAGALLGCTLVLLTGDLGGDLVYK